MIQTTIKTTYPDRYYAQYDPNATQPAPVLGWYNMWSYSSLEGLPLLSNLIPLTEDFWKQHINNPQTPRAVQNGKIVSYIPPAPAPTLESRLQELGAILMQKQEQGVYFKPSSSDKAVLFASDADAQGRLFQALTLAKEGLWVDGSSYMLKDGSFVTMTSADVQELAQKELQFYNSNNTNAHKLQVALQSDINTDLTVGWASNQ